MELASWILELTVAAISIFGIILGFRKQETPVVSVEKRISIFEQKTITRQVKVASSKDSDVAFIMILFVFLGFSVWLNQLFAPYLRLTVSFLLLFISVLYFLQGRKFRLSAKEQLVNVFILMQQTIFEISKHFYNRTYDINAMKSLYSNRDLQETVSTYISQLRTLTHDSMAYAIMSLIDFAFYGALILSLICFSARIVVTFAEIKNPTITRMLHKAAVSFWLYLPMLITPVLWVEWFIFGTIN